MGEENLEKRPTTLDDILEKQVENNGILNKIKMLLIQILFIGALGLGILIGIVTNEIGRQILKKLFK